MAGISIASMDVHVWYAKRETRGHVWPTFFLNYSFENILSCRKSYKLFRLLLPILYLHTSLLFLLMLTTRWPTVSSLTRLLTITNAMIDQALNHYLTFHQFDLLWLQSWKLKSKWKTRGKITLIMLCVQDAIYICKDYLVKKINQQCWNSIWLFKVIYQAKVQ